MSLNGLEDSLDLPQGPEYGYLGIAAYGNGVVVKLMKPKSPECAWVLIDPNTAKQAGELMARCGYAVETRDDINGKSPVIIEQIRKRLVLALAQNFRSKILIHDKIKTEKDVLFLAEECAELMLTEMA